MRTFVCLSDHAEILESGVQLGSGDRVDESGLSDADRWLVDEGRLVDVAEFGEKPARGQSAQATTDEGGEA